MNKKQLQNQINKLLTNELKASVIFYDKEIKHAEVLILNSMGRGVAYFFISISKYNNLSVYEFRSLNTPVYLLIAYENLNGATIESER